MGTSDSTTGDGTVPLRLVTWNLNHWRQPMLPSDTRRCAWEHLRELGVDVVLAQEAVPPPPDIAPTDRVVHGEIGGHRHWGSGVVALDDSIAVEPLRTVRTPWSRRHHRLPSSGAIAIARLHVPGIGPIVLVSVYGLMDGSAVSNMLRVVADLVPVFDSPHGARVILGGDLNVSRATADPTALARAEAVVGAIRALGLVEVKSLVTDRPASGPDSHASAADPTAPAPACPCGRPDTCDHIATWGAAELDHVFVSPALADHVAGLSTDPTAVALGLSDHVPLVLDLRLSPELTPHTWDEESFAEEIGRRHGPAAREVVEKLVTWADQKEHELTTATGARTRGLTRFPTNGVTTEPELWWTLDLELEPRGTQGMISIRASGDAVVQFGSMRYPPFGTDTARNELRLDLNEMPGVDIPARELGGHPTFSLRILEDPANLLRLVAVLERIATETRQRPAQSRGEPWQPAAGQPTRER